MGTGDETDGGGNGKALGGARERSPHDQVGVAHGDGAANRASPARSASQAAWHRAGQIRGPGRHPIGIQGRAVRRARRLRRADTLLERPPAHRPGPRRARHGDQAARRAGPQGPGEGSRGRHARFHPDRRPGVLRAQHVVLCPPGPRAGAPAARQASAEMACLDQADPSGGRPGRRQLPRPAGRQPARVAVLEPGAVRLRPGWQHDLPVHHGAPSRQHDGAHSRRVAPRQLPAPGDGQSSRGRGSAGRVRLLRPALQGCHTRGHRHPDAGMENAGPARGRHHHSGAGLQSARAGSLRRASFIHAVACPARPPAGGPDQRDPAKRLRHEPAGAPSVQGRPQTGADQPVSAEDDAQRPEAHAEDRRRRPRRWRGRSPGDRRLRGVAENPCRAAGISAGREAGLAGAELVARRARVVPSCEPGWAIPAGDQRSPRMVHRARAADAVTGGGRSAGGPALSRPLRLHPLDVGKRRLRLAALPRARGSDRLRQRRRGISVVAASSAGRFRLLRPRDPSDAAAGWTAMAQSGDRQNDERDRADLRRLPHRPPDLRQHRAADRRRPGTDRYRQAEHRNWPVARLHPVRQFPVQTLRAPAAGVR